MHLVTARARLDLGKVEPGPQRTFPSVAPSLGGKMMYTIKAFRVFDVYKTNSN
jgi:hypothetical protein